MLQRSTSYVSGMGTRHRGHEYEIHPSTLRALATGVAAVACPGSGKQPALALIYHPYEGATE